MIDTHCHLTDDKYSADLDEVISKSRIAGVKKIITVGTSLPDSEKALALASKYDFIYAAVGVYPDVVMKKDFRDELVFLAKNKKVVAIGECGLDYTLDSNDSTSQKELLRKQVGTAVQLNLPVIIHNREADADLIEELKRYQDTGSLTGVFHCFTGNWDFAQEVLKLGFYVSFTGIVTYPNTKELEEVIKKIPEDRFMLETDGPYLAPTPLRGKRNEPQNVKIIASRIAELRGTTPERVVEATSRNAGKLFRF